MPLKTDTSKYRYLTQFTFGSPVDRLDRAAAPLAAVPLLAGFQRQAWRARGPAGRGKLAGAIGREGGGMDPFGIFLGGNHQLDGL